MWPKSSLKKSSHGFNLISPVSWNGFPHDYVYGNNGNVFLLVNCSDLGKSCADSVTLPIEQLSPYTDTFDGRADHVGGLVRWTSVTPHPVPGEEIRISNTYALNYIFEPQQEGYAGLSLVFEEPVDLSEYSRVRMKIRFSNEHSTILYRMGSGDNQNPNVYNVTLGDGMYGDGSTSEQTIEIPLSQYWDHQVDPKDIYFISFVAYLSNTPDEGEQTFRVSQIEFLH